MRTTQNVVKRHILRKFIHIVFTLALLVPLSRGFQELLQELELGIDPTLFAYAMLTFAAAFINSLQIRMPNFRDSMNKFFRDLRRRSLTMIENMIKSLGIHELPKGLEELDKMFSRAEENLNTLISELERDYERKYGYVCITFAILSITLSYTLFKSYVFYGILALAIVDSLTAIVTVLTPSMPRIVKHSILAILIAYAVFTCVLVGITYDLFKSSFIALIAIVAEIVGPEDNLTLPFFTSLAAYLIGAPYPLL